MKPQEDKGKRGGPGGPVVDRGEPGENRGKTGGGGTGEIRGGPVVDRGGLGLYFYILYTI